RRLGFVLEVLEQARPAAVHVLAHGGARFRAQPLELAMLQLHQGGIRSLRDEPDLDLGTHCGVLLPLAVEVPADHETLRRSSHHDLPSDTYCTAVFAHFTPPPPWHRLQARLPHRRPADGVGTRPPAPQAGREYLERVRLIGIDANALAHRRDGDCAVHLPLSFSWLVFTLAANAGRSSSQDRSSPLPKPPAPAGAE